MTGMGLAVSAEKKEAEQSIADEAMLTGMEAFLHRLTTSTLKKHCAELSLSGDGDDKDMVWKKKKKKKIMSKKKNKINSDSDSDKIR